MAEQGTPLELPPETTLPEEEQKGFLKKLKRGLFMTHTELLQRLDTALSGRDFLDERTLEHLEETLIGADLGVNTALELVERLKEEARVGDAGDAHRLRQRLADEVGLLLLQAPRPPEVVPGPRVTLVVGVNGVGKTTSIAKLGRLMQRRGRRVLLVAGDTFRAAAVEQLALWAQRLAVELIRQQQGSDPAAVVFDGLQAARARGIDEVIIDTAGRLHNKAHLMRELAKISRVIEREAPTWQRRTLLVLDATTGQNALSQAREFLSVIKVDGVLLAKVDGTAKGGMAVAIARELKLPVLYLGVGESADDLVEFRPREFAQALLA
ncbi:MAG TPA: signal recognition particle-docking protein FtsY [Thermoanaerobaculia bacterium]|jgi:fused signal recognition particle receptor|nr:signal recognition particle-docking protein FtsY [Thermoanaerobaculia bacterium]